MVTSHQHNPESYVQQTVEQHNKNWWDNWASGDRTCLDVRMHSDSTSWIAVT
jgi:hypothetical protein